MMRQNVSEKIKHPMGPPRQISQVSSMGRCRSFHRAQNTAICANSTGHPIRPLAPSSARPHNHAPHGVSRHHGESGPVVALHARTRAPSRSHTCTARTLARTSDSTCEPTHFPACRTVTRTRTGPGGGLWGGQNGKKMVLWPQTMGTSLFCSWDRLPRDNQIKWLTK